ncbi:undecaprenyl-diphosphate phosphatase [Marinoscillum furvescens]|uniref:Undecaprenyl-diphosphatase n=1 Tax=Marinoscillum furvescens DSM 4134 TaxID=1122208 RepID=A0A3D9L8S2_MARFU|nr:undecaprenyl-diphosphate phosphatase [Marinoscillum furvescens]REE01277.1 undecaprenyl-diphosphatase [Marinoscillum furvescens DSM 4134]
MTWLEALILGIIQGLTEFLPVSSSGHLEIGSVLLGVQSEDNLLFAVVVHAATALSTIVVFRKDIGELLQGLLSFQWNESWQFAFKILISMIPVGIIGVFFEDQITSLFTGNLVLVGSMLLITSALLFFTYFKKSNEKPVGWFHAFIIGLAQSIAILPGISRSGATIATALLLGVEKNKATRFSFLMVLVPILGASALKLKDYLEAPEAHAGLSGVAIVIGFVAAFAAGYAACKWMVGIVRKGKLTYFAVYCLIVGLIAILGQIWM